MIENSDPIFFQSPHSPNSSNSSNSSWRIQNVTIVDDDDIRDNRTITISQGKIKEISTTTVKRTSEKISDEQTDKTDGKKVYYRDPVEGDDFYLYPGLINGFDNFLACYYLFDSAERPYRNWLEHDNDLKSSDLFREKMLIPSETLYLLGSFRSIFSATTTVVDHIPHRIHRAFNPIVFPQLLDDFGIAHSISSYHLQWGHSVQQEYSYAINKQLPFILRVAEGTDQYSATDVHRLEELGILGKNTVMIHTLNISDKDIKRIAEHQAHIVWVPESQQFLYGSSTPIEKCLQAGISICLGSGATMNGAKNLFSTMQLAAKILSKSKKQLKIDNVAQMVFKMVTKNASRVFGLPDRGQIRQDLMADFFLLKKKHTDPYENLLKATSSDIQLLCIAGVPIFADVTFSPIFKNLQIKYEGVPGSNSLKIIHLGKENNRQHSFTSTIQKTAHKKKKLHFLEI